MTPLKQNVITIGGALALFVILSAPLVQLDKIIFGPGVGGGIMGGAIEPDIPGWIDAFLYAFPFFLTLLEFFFKKPFLKRRPYLYIIIPFILIGLLDTKFLLQLIIVVFVGVLPGSLYHLIKGNQVVEK